MKKLFTTPGAKGVFFSTILVMVMAAVFLRPILVLYHQQQAGKIIDQVATNIKGSDLISYRCFLGQLIEAPSPELTRAIDHLTIANKIQENDPHTAYLLGQAHCLNQEFDNAIDKLNKAQMLVNNNPKSQIEEGFAYFALANQNVKLVMNVDEQVTSEVFALAEQAFIRGKLNSGSIKQAANDIFESGQLNAAFSFYNLASIFQPLSDHEIFRLYLLAQICGQPERFSDESIDLPILLLEDTLTIYPAQMFRLDQIKPLSRRVVAGKTYGMIFSKKSDSVMLVNFVDNGEYIFELSMLDRPPAPTILAISLDFQPLVEFDLSDGDDQLVLGNFETGINAGVHLISVKLVNDAQVNGVDRNGYIYHLKISKKE
jgi:hypothetical protein